MQNRIKETRKSRDLTQKQLAERVGVGRETVANLESGKYNPSLEVADRIAAALDCHIYEIFPLLDSASYYRRKLDETSAEATRYTMESVFEFVSTAYDTFQDAGTCADCGEPATQKRDGRPLCDSCYWDALAALE